MLVRLYIRGARMMPDAARWRYPKQRRTIAAPRGQAGSQQRARTETVPDCPTSYGKSPDTGAEDRIEGNVFRSGVDVSPRFEWSLALEPAPPRQLRLDKICLLLVDLDRQLLAAPPCRIEHEINTPTAAIRFEKISTTHYCNDIALRRFAPCHCSLPAVTHPKSLPSITP